MPSRSPTSTHALHMYSGSVLGSESDANMAPSIFIRPDGVQWQPPGLETLQHLNGRGLQRGKTGLAHDATGGGPRLLWTQPQPRPG